MHDIEQAGEGNIGDAPPGMPGPAAPPLAEAAACGSSWGFGRAAVLAAATAVGSS